MASRWQSGLEPRAILTDKGSIPLPSAKYYPKGINMILYLTLILKYWQYIVIALCSIVIVALLIRCNILDERNTSLKKENNNK